MSEERGPGHWPIQAVVVGAAWFSEMPFLGHLEEELRNRILKATVAVLVARLSCWTYAVEIIGFLSMPALRIPGMKLMAVGGTEIDDAIVA